MALADDHRRFQLIDRCHQTGFVGGSQLARLPALARTSLNSLRDADDQAFDTGGKTHSFLLCESGQPAALDDTPMGYRNSEATAELISCGGGLVWVI
ncbi:MAG: hypothetical protein U1F55_14730 [Chitinivorax sp.]